MNTLSESTATSSGESYDALLRDVDELRHRLSQAETINFEQSLQLKARADESQTDTLTGLSNRRLFDREFGERCATAQHSGCPLTLAIFDIDHFKAVNDTRGHHVGDAVLRGLAKLLRAKLPDGAILTRFGGEEFALVLSGIFLDNAIEVAEAMRKHVCQAQFRHDGQSLSITVSCGMAKLELMEHQEQLLQRADVALYAAKQAGRNRSFWHDGNELHLATSDLSFPSTGDNASSIAPPSTIVDLSSRDNAGTKSAADVTAQALQSLTHRATRANWCDGGILFWYIRQRIAEWKRGGSAFCVLAIDVDGREEIGRSYGPNALHFMMRAQMLHLDASLRNSDVVARTCHSRIIVVLPGTTVATIGLVIDRMRRTMDRFTYPVPSGLVDYSVSVGISDALLSDDANQVVVRAEAALSIAQGKGNAMFVADGLTGYLDLA